MRDTTKRDAVMMEFSEIVPPSPFGGEREERMADEIVRLRHRAERAERILAKLQKPSEPVWVSALGEYNDGPYATHPRAMRLASTIRAAVAAAEREVDA